MSADMEEGDQLAVWEMKDLGIQATQRIAASADPLRHLADLAGNFPSLATSLSKLKVNESVREEVDRNQKRVRTSNGHPGWRGSEGVTDAIRSNARYTSHCRA